MISQHRMTDPPRNQRKVALLFGVCLLLNLTIFDQELPTHRDDAFAQQKQSLMSHLKNELTCIEAASNNQTLRACQTAGATDNVAAHSLHHPLATLPARTV